MATSGTKPELLLESELRLLGVTGWERSPRDLGGPVPDLYFRHRVPDPLAVYVDGCSWHGCPVHSRPHGNADHGLSREGVAKQKVADRLTRTGLMAKGVRVLVFWEHDIVQDAARCAKHVAAALGVARV